MPPVDRRGRGQATWRRGMGRETQAEEQHLFDLLFIIIYYQRPVFVVQPQIVTIRVFIT